MSERTHRPDRSDRPPPLWLLFQVTIVAIMANTLIGPAIPDILEHFDQPDSAAGWLVATGPAPAVLLAPVTGVLADRFGRRNVLVPSLVLFSAGGLIVATAGSFTAVLLGRMIQGVGSASPMGMVLTLIGDHWEGEQRGRYIAYNSAVLTVAIAVLPAVGGGLAAWGGWRWSFAPQMAGFALAVVLAVRLGRGASNRDASVGAQLAQVRQVLALPGVGNVLLMGFGVFVLIFGLFVALLPILLENVFDMPVGQRGLMLVVPALSSTAASLSLSRLRARRPMRALIVQGAAIATVSYVAVGVSPFVAFVVVASLGYGWFEGVTIPMLQDMVASSAPQQSRAAVVSAWVATVRAGQAVGPLLAGLALALTNERAVFLFGAALMLLLTVFAMRATLPVAASADGPQR